MKLLPQLALLLLSQAATGADVSDTALTSILERHFGDATPAGGASPSFPRYLVADFNADGEQDLVVAFSDTKSLKRGGRVPRSRDCSQLPRRGE